MCHPELHERHDRLEVCSPMRAGMRVVFAVLALFPLLAPYELIVKVEWESYLHPFFLLAALISVGATALSAFLVFAAVAGLSSQMVFDARAATFTYSSQVPLVRPASQVYPLAEVVRVELRERDWSDSAPSYHLGVVMAGGAVFESGSSWSRGEIESLRVRVEQFLSGTQG
jgi:hypothetical protein